MTNEAKRGPGRPRRHAAIPAPETVQIEVRDERPEVTPTVLGRHLNVPGNLTRDEIVKRFGIGAHLRVIRVAGDGTRSMVQEGRR